MNMKKVRRLNAGPALIHTIKKKLWSMTLKIKFSDAQGVALNCVPNLWQAD